MNHLHYELDAGPDDIVEVTLNNAANVQLLDSASYEDYLSGREYRYTGGYVRSSPCCLIPPRSGHWHLVIDLGGSAGSVKASVEVYGAARA